MPQKDYDRIEQLDGATIQHGRLNDRIYLMKIGDADPKRLVPRLDRLADQHGYSKIFAKLPADAADQFLLNGYGEEARIPRFFNGDIDGIFLGKFLDEDRATSANRAELDDVLALAKSKISAGIKKPLPKEAGIRACGAEDAEAMSRIYREVFPSYPFPVDDPEYLRETMHSHIDYFGVEVEGVLAALASAETDRASSNVEMTDFATLPDWRGNGFAVHLLERMEAEMERQGFKTAYTIARAVSPGMNISFARMDYRYGGRLVNNTDISGQIESMNIWFKPLQRTR